MAAMVVPEGMALLPKMAIPGTRPAVLFAVNAVLPAVVVAPCVLTGLSVRLLPPDFTKLSAPVPLSTMLLLMVSVLFV